MFFLGKASRDAIRAAWVAEASQKPAATALPSAVNRTGLFWSQSRDESHSATAFWPADRIRSLPLVVDIHGGSWCRGNKEKESAFAAYLASQGFALFVPDFPQAGETDLRGMLQALTQAIRYGVAHAADFGADPANLFLIGHSSGAQLALALAALSANPVWQQDFAIDLAGLSFRALVLNHPVVFFEDLSGKTVRERGELRFLRQRLFGSDRALKKAFYDPSAYSAAVRYSYPPVRILSSAGDYRYGSQAVTLANLLANNSVRLETDFSSDGTLGHNYNSADIDSLASLTANNGIAGFLLRNSRQH